MPNYKLITMKKSILFFVFALLVLPLIAQDYSDAIVQFMGIPVDGTKTEMISKLRNKGFSYNRNTDELNGRFNGRDVVLKVVENNGVVYRIVVADGYYSNEADIIINYNRLIDQFENNERYTTYEENEKIGNGENIHYEMTINNKRYQAVFYQKYDVPDVSSFDFEYIDDDEYLDNLHSLTENFIKENYGNGFYEESYLKEIQGKTKEEIFEFDKQTLIATIVTLKMTTEMRKSVWFMIDEDERQYRKYRILLFYDNGFNEPNGEDL